MTRNELDSFFSLLENSIKLEFLEFGQDKWSQEGIVDRKTCPWTVIAQSVEGHYELSVDDCSLNYTEPGGLFIVKADTPMTIVHHCSSAHDKIMKTRWLHVHFTIFDTLDLISFLDIPLILTPDKSKTLGNIINDFMLISCDKNKDDLTKIIKKKETAFKVLAEIYSFSENKFDYVCNFNNYYRLKKVLSYIKQNLHENISIEQLAEISGISGSRFHTVFKEYMKTSPINYLISIRLSKACQALVSSDKSVSEIASLVGYDDQFHFCKLFKSKYGVSPSVYRKQHLSI